MCWPVIRTERHGAQTVEALESYRQRYLQLTHLVERFVVIDATLSEDEIWDSVVRNIMDLSHSPASHKEWFAADESIHRG